MKRLETIIPHAFNDYGLTRVNVIVYRGKTAEMWVEFRDGNKVIATGYHVETAMIEARRYLTKRR